MRQPAKVQSVIIPKTRFTKRQAQSWVAKHGFIDPGVDETDDYYRFRQMDPDRQHFKYRTIPFGESGIQAVVQVSRLPQMRSNPDDFDAVVDAIRAAPNELKAMQLAYPMSFQLAHHLGVPVSTARGAKAAMETAQAVAQAVRSGVGAGAGTSVAAKVAAMPEVAQALAGTGLVPVALAQATQIAEVQTSRGVVDVPVVDASSRSREQAVEETYDVPTVDPSEFYDGGKLNLLFAFRKLGSAEGLLADYLHSLSEAEIKNIAKNERATRTKKGSKAELIDALVEDAQRQAERGRSFLMHDVEDLPSVDDAIQAIDRAKASLHAATRIEQTEGLKESVRQVLARLSPSDIKQVAAHYSVDLRRTLADQRVERLIGFVIGLPLRNKVVRGDFDDEAERVRERDEQMQRTVDAHRERHGLPPDAPTRRSNPGPDDFDAVVEAIRAAPNELKAIQLAYPMAFQIAHHLGVPVSTARGAKAAMETAQAVAQAVRSGVGASVAAMPEVAQALAGTGLVPVALAQATQIAEVQTSRGVVEVPVADALERVRARLDAAPSTAAAAHILAELGKAALEELARSYDISARGSVAELSGRIISGVVGSRLQSETMLNLPLGRRAEWEASPAAPSFDEFVQKSVDFWNRREPQAVLTLERLKEYQAEDRKSLQYSIDHAESDIRNSPVAAVVHSAAQTFRVIAQWYGANTGGFSYFQDRAADVEAKAMKMFRAAYAQKYGVSPPDAPTRRSNPGPDDFDAVVDAIRAAPNDLKAIQLAYPMAFQIAHHLGVPVSTARGAKAAMETAQAVAQAVRSGAGASVAAMPEVAQALAGTGLVPVALAQATQIAEVQTSRGVVEVPVVEASVLAPDQRTTAPSVARERFSLSALFPFDATVEVIDRAKRTAQTATRHDQTTGLKERVEQVLARLPVSDLKKIAAHYNVDLRRTPANQRVQKIIEGTVGYTLTARAIRGDYEEDEEARVRERDEQQQWMIAQYREREGLPPAQASGVEGIEGAKRAGVEILSTMPPERRGGSPKILMVRVPPGSYWIGDPSASIPPKQFDDLVGGSDVVGTVDGYPVVVFSLENGDMGDYRDDDGYEYPIDSGMLGLVDARIEIDEQDASIREKVMRLVRFDKPTICAFEFDGSRWIFGNVVIKDRDAEEEEEEEEEWDDDDDDDTFDDKD